MTLIVGIQCSDGVVMASDSAATLGTGVSHTIGQQRMKKISNLSGHILYGSTGAVGMAQLIQHAISAHWKSKGANPFATSQDGEVMQALGGEIVKAVGQYLQTGVMIRQLGFDGASSLCKSLVAIPVQKIPTLLCFDFGGQPEKATPDLPFMAVGSGQPIADPFLAFLKRLLWPKRAPTLSEGRLAAVWTIAHVIGTNAGGVGGDIQLWTLPAAVGGVMPTVKEFGTAEVQEHLNQIDAAEKVLVTALAPAPAAPAAAPGAQQQAQPGAGGAAAPPPPGPGPAPAA